MGTLSVSDARSNVEVGRTLYIASYGDGSNGTLTLTDSGAVNVNSDISMGIANTSGSAAVNIGADTTDPSDAARPGVLAAAEIGFWEDSARLNFNHTCDAYIFDTPLVSGNNGASFVHHYAGDTILTGNSADFSGDTIVHDGQLTVDGDLSLSSDSIPDFELGSPGASAVATGISDRIDIIGDLALNGKLNLSQSNELQSDANEAITGNLILPFGLLLGSGITLAVDEQPVMSALPFRTCLPVGCIVPLLFDQATLDALRAGTTLTVTAQFSPNE